MLKKISLENFKSFSEVQDVKLAPITLIYGPNSSGKSTIIQSLLLLKQTLLAKGKGGQCIGSGKYIDLGEFESFVHNHNISNSIKFHIDYSLKKNAREHFHETSTNLLFSNDLVRKLSLGISSFRDIPSIDNIKFNCGVEFPGFIVDRFRQGGYKFSNSEKLMTYISKKINIDQLKTSLKEKLIRSFSETLEASSTNNLPFINKQSIVSPINDFMGKISDDIGEILSSIEYLGPLRSSPKRIYSGVPGKSSRGKGNLGLELAESGDQIITEINQWLVEFEIPYQLSIQNIGNHLTGPVVAVELEDQRSGAKITPLDVGFGIGQVLPIILEALIDKNKVICVEQPEIHLHPRLQAHLADLFISSVNTKDKNNQWIIETHSEALLLRLQKRIRSGKISKELVSILYVDVGKGGAVVTDIPLDENGDFMVHWPNGFFEERLDEIMD